MKKVFLIVVLFVLFLIGCVIVVLDGEVDIYWVGSFLLSWEK